MRVFVFFLTLISFPAAAQDCLGQSEAFFELVAAKWAVNKGIENNPESFEGEKWLYIWGGSTSAFEEKEISGDRAKSMARLVAENDFSENPEIEVNIFEDYWYLSCELQKDGNSVVPLGDIDEGKLIECWNTVASREEFQSCLLPLIKQSSAAPGTEPEAESGDRSIAPSSRFGARLQADKDKRSYLPTQKPRQLAFAAEPGRQASDRSPWRP